MGHEPVHSAAPIPMASAQRWRPHPRVWVWSGLAALALLGVVLSLATRSRHAEAGNSDNPPTDEDEFPTETALKVKTVYAHIDRSFARTVKEPAYVEEFMRADLYANVAGTVKFIQVRIGDTVTEGQLLVELDVPDRVEEVAQRAALVKQAEAELIAAQAEVLRLEESRESARIQIEEKLAEMEHYVAARQERLLQMQRIAKLVKNGTYAQEYLDEKEAAYKAAAAACKSAEAAEKRARSEFQVAAARVTAARAELEVKQTRILVAQKELSRAQAVANFAKIRAPFTGKVVSRNVDPGSFVQNATTAHTRPCLSIRRLDKVIVYTMVPEKSIPYVSKRTEAVLQLDALPNQEIHAQVTRYDEHYNPEKGRTMRAEVELYNPPQPSNRGASDRRVNYQRAVVQGVTAFVTPLAAVTPTGGTVLMAAGQRVWGFRHRHLRPGMYGTMRLVLQKFDDDFLVPCSAYFTDNSDGHTYIYQVEDGKAHRVPVLVIYEDGKKAKIKTIVREASGNGNQEEILADLTGKEEIIYNNQGEIQEGQEVESTVVEWAEK